MAGSRKIRVDKQRGNNAGKTPGKPFAKGNTIGFQPGQSGNPQGRPKKRTLSEHLREVMARTHPEHPDRTYGELIAIKLAEEAVSGNVTAAREVFDRLEGRPRQQLDVTVDSRKQQLAQTALDEYLRQAEAEGEQMTEAEAAEKLALFIPELSPYLQ
ncbi:MAG TPA: DUF5681 domain-containing protein [Blastocatellia bacterium]|nr:DUF5681 domain-containing protein [Blastocatellia bacterium]